MNNVTVTVNKGTYLLSGPIVLSQTASVASEAFTFSNFKSSDALYVIAFSTDYQPVLQFTYYAYEATDFQSMIGLTFSYFLAGALAFAGLSYLLQLLYSARKIYVYKKTEAMRRGESQGKTQKERNNSVKEDQGTLWKQESKVRERATTSLQ